MNWLTRHARTIEAIAASITALVAVAALVGIKLQLDATDTLQRAQSARDSYRAHLVLATQHPQFAQPIDGCQLIASPDGGSYRAFVDHLLYSAEQMLVVSEGWETTFLDALAPHTDYICSGFGPRGETLETAALLSQFLAGDCPAKTTCQ